MAGWVQVPPEQTGGGGGGTSVVLVVMVEQENSSAFTGSCVTRLKVEEVVVAGSGGQVEVEQGGAVVEQHLTLGLPVEVVVVVFGKQKQVVQE